MNASHAVFGIQADKASASEVMASDAASEGIEPKPLWARAILILAVAVSVAWIVGVTWLARGEIGRFDPIGLVQFVASLCALPTLIGIVWIVASRRSAAERLFAGAREMRHEAEALARTVTDVSAAIDGNRDALNTQILAMTEIGDNATDRLTAIGRGLSKEIDQAGIHARALDEAAAGAEARLATMLSSMPCAQDQAKTLGELIERVGISADAQIAELDARLLELAAHGRDAEVVANNSARTLATYIAQMDSTSETAGARLEAATAAVSSEIDALLQRTVNAVDASREDVAAQSDAMAAMVENSKMTLVAATLANADALAERIEGVERVIDRVAGRLEAQRQAGDGVATDLEGWIDRIEARFDTLKDEGTRRAQELAASIASLGDNAETMNKALRVGDDAAVQVIATTEALLIALDAAARELDETLPGALVRLDGCLDETRRRIEATSPELLALVTASQTTHTAVTAVAAEISDQRASAETVSAVLNDGLTAGRDKASGLDQLVNTAITRVDQFVEDAAPRLLEALLRVRESANAAADRARETLAAVIPETADALEVASAAAMKRAAGAGVEARIASINDVAEAAVGATARAADRLEQQLARIAETVALVDTRLEEDRAQRESDDRDSFARRASSLIESMNSASIDLTRSLSPEISDTAWTEYLKGDQGVFTRRAVRLLNTAEQQDVAQFYDRDEAFREQVNRYIHEFESMIRTILGQPEGMALCVILLSSDMGRLYVAMAQAIDRLR